VPIVNEVKLVSVLSVVSVVLYSHSLYSYLHTTPSWFGCIVIC